jgi:RHS repeat-associated protein
MKSFVYALGKHLARVDGAIGDPDAKKYWYVTDHLGSVRAVTDVDGKKVWSADYLAFGTQYGKDSDTDFEELHSFTGKELDPDTGLYYYCARWYDSELGRFVSEDPAGDPNNPNLYVYGANNPLRYSDPTGLYGYDASTGTISHADGTITDTNGNVISTPPGGSNPGYYHDSPISSYQSVTTPTNVPGVNYSFYIAIYSEDVSVMTETYTNKDGATVTVTTTERGNVTEQVVTVTDKDGNSQTQTLSYVKGVPVKITDQRNVIAVDDFVTGAKKYRAIVIVVGKEEGAVGAWQGSTKPNNPSYAEIVEGVYKLTKGKHYSKYGNESDENGSYYWAAILNNNEPIDTTNENPRHNNQKWANYIHFHSGFSDISNGSEGCLTIRPGKGNYPNGSNWSSFYDAIGGNEANEGNYIGSVYVSRL